MTYGPDFVNELRYRLVNLLCTRVFDRVCRRRNTVLLAFLVFTFPAFSQAPQPEQDALIHFGDLIDVDVVGGFEYDWRGTLTPEGFLDGANSFGEPIYGLCRTEDEVASELTKAFSRFLRNPKVIVRLIDRSNRAVVTLDGAVRFPQRFQLRRATHLRELIVLSGGLTDHASGEIRIVRPRSLNCDRSVGAKADTDKNGVASGGTQVINVSIGDLINGLDSSDLLIRSGDLITVQSASPIYITGGVNNPRPIYTMAKMRVSRAIAAAGGLTKNADGAHAALFRRVGQETSVINLNLDKLIEDGSEDVELNAYDILEVPEKGRPKREKPPVIGFAIAKRSGVLPLRIVE